MTQPSPAMESEYRRAIVAVTAFVREYPRGVDPRGLLLFGPNGIGKTHLAVAALKTLLERGHEGRFVNYQALLRTIRDSYDENFGGSTAEVYRSVEEAEILVLDDLGSHRVTNWVEDTITDIIAQRHDCQRATIVTTNYSPTYESSDRMPALADRIGEHATSRLREMCLLVAIPHVPDYRGRNQRS